MPDAGICVLSIDVIHDNAGTAELCRQFSQAGVPVVWGLSSSPSDELADAIRGHSGSEVALRADGWASEPSDRRTFLQSLTDGLARLRAGGFVPTTIALPFGSLAAHDDLLVKHQFSAARVSVRRSSTNRRTPKLGVTHASNSLSALRWGLWEALISTDLNQAGPGGALRTIDRICDRGGVAVVAAPCDVLATDVKTASRLINQLTGRQQDRGLRLATLAAIVAELQATRPASARSILRPAA